MKFILLFLLVAPTLLFSQKYLDEVIPGTASLPNDLNSAIDLDNDPNHTNIIINAIAALDEGEQLLFRAGRYNINPDAAISGHIILNKATSFIGAGKERTIFYSPAKTIPSGIFRINSSDVTFDGLTFKSERTESDTDYPSLMTSNNNAIFTSGDNQPTFFNIQILDCSFYDMQFGVKVSYIDDLKIENCNFHQCLTSIHINYSSHIRLTDLISIRDEVEDVDNLIHHIYTNSVENLLANSIYCKGYKMGKSMNIKMGEIGDSINKNIVVNDLISEGTGKVFVANSRNITFNNPVFIDNPGFYISGSELVEINGIDFVNSTDEQLFLLANSGIGSEVSFQNGNVRGPMKIQLTNFEKVAFSDIYFKNCYASTNVSAIVASSNKALYYDPYVNFDNCIFDQDESHIDHFLFDLADSGRYIISNCTFENSNSVAMKYVSVPKTTTYNVTGATHYPYIEFDNCKVEGFNFGFVRHETEWLVPLSNFYVNKNCGKIYSDDFVINEFKHNTNASYLSRGQSYIESSTDFTLSTVDAFRVGHEITIWNTDPTVPIVIYTEGNETINSANSFMVNQSVRLVAFVDANGNADWKQIRI